MSLAYLAATAVTESPADRATLWTFVPRTPFQIATTLAAGIYAHARWRNGWYTGAVAFAGFKVPLLTGVLLGLDAIRAARRH